MEEGYWQWAVSAVPVVYTNWEGNVPTHASNNEHCMETSAATGWKWNDNQCNTHQNFLCEIEL
jgi:hypothetical protein